jgi:hypothetical protein
LRDLNRIAFFETERRLPKLAVDIRSCAEPRVLEDSDRQLLRRQYLPEAIKLFDDGLVSQVAVGRFFGLDRIPIYMWFKQYRQKGREGLLGRWSGRLTPEWRRKTMELYAKSSPIKSRWDFYQRLKKKYVDFPYGYSTVKNVLNEAGEKCTGKEMMTQKWRDRIDRELAKFERPPRKAELFNHLKKGFKFPYGRKTLESYLDAAGLSPIRRRSVGGSRVTTTELRPEC